MDIKAQEFHFKGHLHAQPMKIQKQKTTLRKFREIG